MKIAVLIMSTLEEPSTRNINAMKNTFIKYVNENKMIHSYDFYFYYAKRDNGKEFDCKLEQESENVYNVYINTDESIYRTFEKTYYTLYSNALEIYDYYIRVNISSFINFKLFDLIAEKLDKEIVYCNAINSIVDSVMYNNEIYPRGDFFCFSKKIKDDIKENMKSLIMEDSNLKRRTDVIHVDDCLIGISLLNTYGNEYGDKIRMIKYSFLPGNDIKTVNKFSVASRVKTIPPDKSYSGYSWDDNEFRKIDVNKMEMLDNYVRLTKYEQDPTLENILENENTCRPVICINYKSIPVATVKNYLKTKKRGI